MAVSGGVATRRSGMRLKPRIVLHSPVAEAAKLALFVDQCLRDGVRLIAIVADGCEALEEEIDWLIIRDGFDPDRLICTSSHPDQPLDEVLEFASTWTCHGEDGVQELRL